MKKKRKILFPFGDEMRLQFRKMKLTAILLFIVCVTFGNSFSQVRLTVRFEKTDVRDALQTIEEKTDYIFLYKDQIFDFSKKVSADFTDAKFEDVLKTFCDQTNVSYEVRDRQIILKEKDATALTEMQQQKRQLSGTVKDNNGQPLPGVTVVVKGTTTGVITDDNGNYSMSNVSSDATLLFSFVGMKTQEVKLAGKSKVDVIMEEESVGIEEVVAVGYGKVKKSDLTSAISTIKGNDIIQRISPRLDEALQGQLSGVSVQQTSGVPGNAPLIRIRGISSISSGNSPLFVIDGFPVEDNTVISNLNMNDVESIEILKDAASASIYGSRGSNGVVLITTRMGKAGKAKVSFNTYYGVQKAEKLIDFMDGNETGQMITEIRNYFWVKDGGKISDPNSVRPANRRIDPQWASGSQPTYDTQNYIFQTAPIQNHSLSINGGDQNSKYFVSLDYLNQEGIARGTGFERYSVRTNFESQVHKRIKLGINLSPSYSTQIDRNTEGKDNNLNGMLRQSPIIPFDFYYDPVTHQIANDYAKYYGNNSIGNRFYWFDRVPDQKRRSQIITNAYVDAELMKDLHFKSNVGLLYDGLDRQQFYDLESGEGTIHSDRWNGWSTNWLWENTLNYTKTIAKHSFSILAGYTSQKDYAKSTAMSGKGHANDLSSTINNATVISSWDEKVSEWSLLSMLGRITYNFDSRYLVTASIRRDGSSRFGMNNRWGIFPSFSAAWRLSEEAFLKENELISNLKLRASWGQTGNNKIGNYSAMANLKPANTPLGVGETAQAGLLPSSFENDNLGWERTASTNIGLDLGLFHDRLTVTFEGYNNITSDLLLNVPIPLSSGFGTQLQNIGKVRNKGFEMDIFSRNLSGAFEWNTRFNFSANKNEVLAMGPNDTPIITGEWYASVSYTGVGHPIGSYYMLVQEGIFQNQAEVDAGPRWSNEGVGDVKIKDVNRDGKLNNDDRDFVGQPFPIWNAGLTNEIRYKNFDLSFFINAAGGHKSFFITGRYYDRVIVTDIASYTSNWNNRWRSEDDPGDGRTPTALSSATTNGGIPTTRWLYKSDWWRLKNITLGYSLPKKISQHLGIESLRIYATGDNLFLGTKYPGYNPEGVSINGESVSQSAGYDFGVYPLSKRIVLGLNVNF